MRLIDADILLTERKKSKYYHLPNGDIAIPIIDIEHAPTIEVSEDAISRAKLQYEILEEFGSEHKDDETINKIYGMVINAPSVTPSRPQGKWIKKEHGYKCTACNLTNDGESLFCPQCGAKMKGADNE